jgi:hypothetical protein
MGRANATGSPALERLFWLSAVLGSTVGCAANAATPAQAPIEAVPGPARTSETRGLTELDALEHDLEVSEQRLEQHLAAGQPAPADEQVEASGAQPSSAEPPPAPPPPPPGAAGQRAPERKASRAETSTDRGQGACRLSCRALASMRRAAEGICDLAPGNVRCIAAKARVDRGAERVADAGCVCEE